MPEGVTGWLMPADEVDTDVACGAWNGEVYILGVKDKRTGRKQTLLGECVDVATGQIDDCQTLRRLLSGVDRRTP